MGDTFQIKTLNLEHKCSVSNYNRKVTSEYLAEKFLEFWRTNIDWKLKKFQEHVMKELNVHVSYAKCWLARSRAKLIIYGNGKDQYARVWDYANVIKKYNEGSTAFVTCGGIDRPPVYFKRMYICLQPLKEGFIKGCRPIFGVDGCHLKGPYPGMYLVAVGKDGNNNIFPLAWAVVEVENIDSWTWFLELLANDLGMEEGKGFTIMSDRQKGLLDALGKVVTRADIRYYVRHIWANFKINWSGQVYKDSFWMAARATTKGDFDREMEGIKSLSTEAWTYLNNIPPRHWSRHAFDTNCKSNMLLNNLCETFNSVLKKARDKPILTHMEWMRRYVMKRNCEKREGALKYDDLYMPYTTKYKKWAIDQCRFCKISRAYSDKFELCGVPCVHAVGCILSQRGKVDDYIHEAYSKAKYQLAYEPCISPMPGVNQWEKSGLPEPLPPLQRKMPGRPSNKQRRKEAGEGERKTVKRVKKKNKCSNCGQLGHYKITCKNPSVPPKQQSHPGGRPFKTTAWAKQGREKAEERRALKATYAAAGPSQTHTTATHQQPSQSSAARSSTPTQTT
ncbi:uncharacterized protein LOC141607161 [Silene latifolia]|uniref:uncharacterized protein LOC141607161 n=1 Tax=Silene latifolia TaxID=37657 RepID=UPI003D7754C7